MTDPVIDEVVVIGQNRTENIQDVPVAIRAINNDPVYGDGDATHLDYIEVGGRNIAAAKYYGLAGTIVNIVDPVYYSLKNGTVVERYSITIDFGGELATFKVAGACTATRPDIARVLFPPADSADIINACLGAIQWPCEFKNGIAGDSVLYGKHVVFDSNREFRLGDTSDKSPYFSIMGASAGGIVMAANVNAGGHAILNAGALGISVSAGDTLYQAASGGIATTGTFPIALVKAADTKTVVLSFYPNIPQT
jgi:hypothetical protein